MQDAWLRLQRAEYDMIDNLAGWLTRVTGRIALNMVRDEKEHAFDGFVPEPVVAPEDESNPEHEALLSDAIGIALQG